MNHSPAYEHNGRPVSREAFYAVACDPRRSVAVEACAGAGKTWMLVSRILRALLDGCPPHEILAITFTKKAAGEMRQRLHEWLGAFALADDATLRCELVARGMPMPADPGLASALVASLRNLYPTVLDQGRPVQVRTFHSWFAALLRYAPLAVLNDLGLPANYQLLEDDSPAVALVWRRFHRALASGETLAAERADFHAVVAVHGRSQTQKALAAALAKRVEFTLADRQGVVADSVAQFGAVYPAFAGLEDPVDRFTEPDVQQALWAAARALGQASAPTFAAKGSALEQALSAGEFEAACAALLTAEGTPRKFSDKVVGIAQVRIAQDLVLTIVGAQQQHEAWLYQQRMARLTRVLVAEFSALKRERGWVDMNDVEQAALVMLSDAVLSGWVQERLDARVRHLLIDEFQDTNPLQWQALSGWLGGYAGAGGSTGSASGGAPSVFIVGDPKQSIYRFRRAEPQVFRAAQAFVAEGLGGDRLSCDHTRRNAPAVTAAVNAVMAEAQGQGGYEGFRTHTTESTTPGTVLCLPQVPRDSTPMPEAAGAAPAWRDSLTTPREEPEDTLRTLECRQAAQWLAAQLADPAQALTPGAVMVLSRKRDRLAVMQTELRALGIATQQPEKADLADAPEVQDLVALLDALVSPAHDLSLARALKSPIFGVDDADLVAIALRQRAAEAPTAWFTLLTREDWTGALASVGPTLLRWQGWLATWPPHDALDAIFHDGDLLARFAAAAPAPLREGVLARLRALLGATLALDGARYATPYALVRALKAGGLKAPSRADPQAVRLLTVHGAKGLEAELVLLLDTDAPPAVADTMGLLVDWPGEAEWPQRFVFLARESQPPACAEGTLLAEQQARAREELNTLYVAMTRARRQLVLSAIAPHRTDIGSWWQRLGPQARAVDAVPPPATATSPLPSESPILLSVLPLAIGPVEKFAPEMSASVLASEADTLASRLGQAVHRLLEWAPLSAPGEAFAWPPATVAAAARAFGLNAEQGAQAEAIARRIRHGDGAWAWDASVVDWQANEVELWVQGQRQRIDRLVRRRDTAEWWVLDHKSEAHPERNAALWAQLRRYRDAVQALYPQATVRAALLNGQGGLSVLDAASEKAGHG